MNIEEIGKLINSNPKISYLIKDKDVVRTPYRSEINFKSATIIDNVEDLECNTDGIADEITDAIQKLKDINSDALSFSFCGGLVAKSDKYKIENIDDLFLYKLTVYPVNEDGIGYKRINSTSRNIYECENGKIERIIHFRDLLGVLEVLDILPLYVDENSFKVLVDGFLTSDKPSCKPVLFTIKMDKGRVLKKD